MQKIDLNLQQLNHFDLPLRMLKIVVQNFKISRGNMPLTLLDTPAFGGCLFLGKLFLSNLLSLHSTGSHDLELLSVRRIFVVPNIRFVN